MNQMQHAAPTGCMRIVLASICRRLAANRPLRRTVIALLVVLALVLLHSLILRTLAWPLQSADPAAPAECFCLHGDESGIDGFDALDRAAERGRAGGLILLILPRTSRVVEIGAAPSFEQTCRRELIDAGSRRAASSRFPPTPATLGTKPKPWPFGSRGIRKRRFRWRAAHTPAGGCGTSSTKSSVRTMGRGCASSACPIPRGR